MGRRISAEPDLRQDRIITVFHQRVNDALPVDDDLRFFPAAYGTSRIASINSSPLFIRVAESTVIFAPMLQLGCFSASALVTFCSRSRTPAEERAAGCGQDQALDLSPVGGSPAGTGRWRNALNPPERSPPLPAPPGPSPVHRRRPASPYWPAQYVCGRRMAASVGRRPIIPMTAVTTVSALGSVAASIRPSIPEATRIPVSANRMRKLRRRRFVHRPPPAPDGTGGPASPACQCCGLR